MADPNMVSKGAYDTQVLVIGGGPIGMILAMDLASRGVKVTVVEQRPRREPPSSVKCNHISARTMEIFRRLGIVDTIRNAKGLPHDYPNDVACRTSVVGGFPITRIPIPSRNNRDTDFQGPDTWWPTSEHPHRLNQIYLEPLLFDHLVKMPGVEILSRTALDDFRQDGSSVIADVTDLDTGESRELRARYLVGCDGSRSVVRKTIGAKFEGTPLLFESQSTYIRAPKLIDMIGEDRAWMVHAMNGQSEGYVFAIDGVETWLISAVLGKDQTFDSVDRDKTIRAILGVDENFEFEVLRNEDWTARRLVANRYRDRSVFICGDAAQLWVPFAGYGMNAGIASATNLSWLLAATLKGWAPESILDAYEGERHPINEQVSRFAMKQAVNVMAETTAMKGKIERDDEAGAQAREQLGKALYELHEQQSCCGGLNFGYYYDQSPIIAYDGEEAPAYTMSDFTPSTVPGCRVPYFELEDGQPLYDLLGDYYTLIRFDPNVPVDALLAAAEKHGVPMDLVDIDGSLAPDCYKHKLLLSRPDRHVAWRGDAQPDQPDALIDLIRGAGHAMAQAECA